LYIISPFFELRLFQYAVQGPDGDIVAGMARDCHATRFYGMLELSVAAFCLDDILAVFLDHFDDIANLH